MTITTAGTSSICGCFVGCVLFKVELSAAAAAAALAAAAAAAFFTAALLSAACCDFSSAAGAGLGTMV